jgi:hypothetical protein
LIARIVPVQREASKPVDAVAEAAAWADLEALIAEIGACLPENAGTIDAINDIRRDL